MRLLDLSERPLPPEPWAEGDNIPWHDPAFSARMLDEHLSQDHDLASRRADTIDRQVAWIHECVLGGRATAILDLACGPGLYTSRLARLGHTCVGIDYGPAAIRYAVAQADAEGLTCRYRHEDLRHADFGTGFGLVMLIYGELNVFPRTSAAHILAKAQRGLGDGGILLVEPHTSRAIRRMARRASTWYTAARGLFGEAPHLCLREHFWEPALKAATTRYFVVDLATGAVTRHAQSFQAYTRAEYRTLLSACGFESPTFFPSLTGAPDDGQRGLCAIVARKAPSA